MIAGRRYLYRFVGLCTSILDTLAAIHDESERERNDAVLVALWTARDSAGEAVLNAVVVSDIHARVTGQRINPDQIRTYAAEARKRVDERTRGESAIAMIRRAIDATKGKLHGEHCDHDQVG